MATVQRLGWREDWTWCYLRDIPYEDRSLEICLAAIKYTGRNLEFVPDDKKTVGLCLDAVLNYIHAIRFVPIRHLRPKPKYD